MKKKQTVGSDPEKDKILLELREVADRLSIQVLFDDLTHAGTRAESGSCFFRGSNYIILDRKLDTSERIRVLARELAKFDLEGMYLSPAIRDLIKPESNE